MRRVERAERRAKFWSGVWREAVTHDVLGDDTWDHELEKVVAASGFRPAA